MEYTSISIYILDGEYQAQVERVAFHFPLDDSGILKIFIFVVVQDLL